MRTERKGKKTFSLAQKAYLNSLFEAGLRSASKSQRPFLGKAAADTGLTISQVSKPCLVFILMTDFFFFRIG